MGRRVFLHRDRTFYVAVEEFKSLFIFAYIFQICCKEEEDLLVDSAVYRRVKGGKNSQPLSIKPLSSGEVVMVM